MAIYNDIDKELGHFRRYSRKELSDKLKEVGFKIENIGYFDCLGVIPWFLLKFVPGKNRLDGLSVTIYDKAVFPISKILDLLFNRLFGKNLVVIASKQI